MPKQPAYFDSQASAAAALQIDFCLTIVEAAGDNDLREVFRQTILNWLQLNFSEIADAKARKAHPKIMSWFRSETEVWARRKDEADDLEVLIQTLNGK
jgi:hypothetical protein